MVKSRQQTARKPASEYANLQKKMQKQNAGEEDERQEDMTTQPFIPAKELKREYGVFGHFYSVELASKELVHSTSTAIHCHHFRKTNGTGWTRSFSNSKSRCGGSLS